MALPLSPPIKPQLALTRKALPTGEEWAYEPKLDGFRAIVFVAHDIGVVRHISDRIAVMTHGKIVETGAADQVCEHPRDDYTKKLLAAVPIPDPRESRARRERTTAG